MTTHVLYDIISTGRINLLLMSVVILNNQKGGFIMNIAVRYYSRSGNTKKLAEAIASSLAVPAISVDSENAEIKEEVDVLFIGGALYAYGLDKNLKDYLENLDGEKVKRAVVFSTSWLSKHSVDLIKKGLAKKGIKVEEEYCYCKNTPSDDDIKNAEQFAKKMITD